MKTRVYLHKYVYIFIPYSRGVSEFSLLSN